MISSATVVAPRGPSTYIHLARTSPAAPTPLQLATGVRASGYVYVMSSLTGTGAGMRPVWPSTIPPNPKPSASEKLGVTCHVGSIVPAKRKPDRPRSSETDAY